MKTKTKKSIFFTACLTLLLCFNNVAYAEVKEDLQPDKRQVGDTEWVKIGNALHAAIGEKGKLEKGSLSYSRKVFFQEPKIASKGEYDSIILPGLDNWTGSAGAPVVPFKTLKLLIPYGEELAGVKVIHGERREIIGRYLIEPTQEQYPLSKMDEAEPTLPDPLIYESDDIYPSVPCGDAFIQKKHGYTILILNLFPVEYSPKSGKLAYYTEMAVELETVAMDSSLSAISPRQTPKAIGEISSLVDNPELFTSYNNVQQKEGTLTQYEYVIITTEALKNSTGTYKFQDIVASKQAKGLTATIVTVDHPTDGIYANYTGLDNPDKIRNFVIDYYTNHGTQYVLLGGNRTHVPYRLFRVYSSPFGGGYQADMPVDIYYGCLDGTFDYDGDGKYGELNDGPGGGEVDLFAEVYVGRAPVENTTELSNFVNKTLDYENSADDYLHNAYMVGELLWSDPTWGADYMEEIRLGANTHGYTTVGFENSPYADFFNTPTLYDKSGTWDKTQLINIINTSDNQIYNHLGHCNYTYAMRLYTSDLPSLTNTNYFFAYSQGCMPGGFDTNECFAEVVTTMEEGAFAVVMNARYGWGAHNSTDGASQHYDRQFWDALFSEGITGLGKMNQDSKEDNSNRLNESCMRWCYYELNLFGDPELAIKASSIPMHTITATSGPGGIIDPNGAVQVQEGDNQSFDIIPNATYHIVDVTVDSVSQGPITTYPFLNVIEAHTIHATFAQAPRTLTVIDGSGSGTHYYGDIVDIAANPPAVGYRFDEWTGDIAGIADIEDPSTTLTMPNSDVTITAEYRLGTYELNAQVGPGGSDVIKVPDKTGYAYGESVGLTAEALPTYHFTHWTGEFPAGHQLDNPLDITIEEDVDITANFAESIYTIQASAGLNGSITPSGTIQVHEGDDQSFTITANPGFYVSSVSINGGPAVLADSLSNDSFIHTFRNVTQNNTIYAEFDLVDPAATIEAIGGKNLIRAYLDGKDPDPLLSMDIASASKDNYIDIVATQDEIAAIEGMGFRIVVIPVNATDLFEEGSLDYEYHTYASVEVELHAIEAQYPDIAKVYSIGQSIEGRDIWALKISDNVEIDEPETKFFIVGNHHAREIMTPEIPLYQINYLVDGYDTDPSIRAIVDNWELWFVPMANPDGHVNVESGDIWWRKNRRINSDGSIGVDPNRNYGYTWAYDDVGSSPTPSSSTYRGTAAFSEPETQAIRDLLEDKDFDYVFDYHSYGEMILYPWGHITDLTPDNTLFEQLSQEFKTVIPGYVSGQPSRILYRVNGDSINWEYGEQTTKPKIIAFTFEVNSSQEGGFRPPASLIEPTCQEHLQVFLKVVGGTANFYTITATSSVGGNIQPDGAVSVPEGSNQTFTMSTDPGYYLADVLVDGSSAGNNPSYTFQNVTEDHTIHAVFEPATTYHTIVATAGANGSINPSGAVNVLEGSDADFIITPDQGYNIKEVIVNGGATEELTDGNSVTYTFTNVTQDHTIHAEFELDTYIITATAGPNGNINPSGDVEVQRGSNQTFDFIPNGGYVVADVLVDGSSIGAPTSHTFSNVTSGHTIHATFDVDPMPVLTLQDHTVIDDWTGMSVRVNGDRHINPGEQIELQIELKNTGTQSANNVSAVISTTDPDIEIVKDTVSFCPSITPGQSCASSDNFVIEAFDTITPPHTVTFDLLLTADGYQWNEILQMIVLEPVSGGGSPSDPVRLDTGNAPGASSSYYSNVTTDGRGNVYVVYSDERNGASDIYLNCSHDYGTTWLSEDIRIDTSAAGSSTSSAPKVKCDNNGNVYVVWSDGRIGGPQDLDVYFNYSTDYGVTWQASDIRIDTDDPGSGWSSGPEMACDNNGNVYVRWIDYRHGDWDIYFNCSHDNGATWKANDIRINTNAAGTSNSASGDISCDNNGNVYVLWRDTRNNYDIYLNRSHDYGNTWLTQDVRINRHTSSYTWKPAITSDENGYVYAVWCDNRNVEWQVYFNYSDDHGVTWQSSDIRISDQVAEVIVSYYPKLASDENGNIYATWVDWRGTYYDLYFSRSTNHGATWSNDIRLNTDFAQSHSMYLHRLYCDEVGGVYAVWDCRNTAAQRYYPYLNYSRDYGVTWLNEAIKLDVGIGADPYGMYARVACDDCGNTFITWQDYCNGLGDVYLRSLTIPSDFPEVYEIADYTVNEQELLEFGVTGKDDDKNELELFYSISALSQQQQTNMSNATISVPVYNPVTGENASTFSWTPALNTAGLYDPVYFVARNLQTGRCGFKDMRITVTETGYTLSTISQNGSIAKLPDQARYNPGDIVQLTAEPNEGYSFVNWSGDLSGTENPKNITMNASKIVIANFDTDDTAPNLLPIGNKEGIEDQDFIIKTMRATDVDGDGLTIDATDLPSGARFFQTGSGEIAPGHTFVDYKLRWPAKFVKEGVYTVTFTASDEILTDSETITITIRDAGNRAPILRNIGDREGPEKEWFAITKIIATDPDGDDLTMQIANRPSGVKFILVESRPGYVEYKLKWAPRFVKQGVYENVTFTVSDGTLTDAEAITITITDTGNLDPALRPIGDREGREGEWFAITKIIATDDDSDNLTMTVENLPPGSRFIKVEDRPGYIEYKLKWPPECVQAGVYENVTFTVQDGVGDENSESITITIERTTPHTLIVNNGTGSGEYGEGEVADIEAAVPAGYEFIRWLGDIQHVANPLIASTTITMYEDSEVTANLLPSLYFIIASSGNNGTIEPEGPVPVEHGGASTFIIQANAGYMIQDVLVDGTSTGPRSSHTFTNVTSDHTIHAIFAAQTHTITATAGSGGSITPSGSVQVAHGANQAFTIQANAGYLIQDVLADGVSIGPVPVHAFYEVVSDHTIHAIFTVQPPHTITATAGSGGSINPSGSVYVADGGSQTFIIQPNAGYMIQDVLVDGVSIGPASSHTFYKVVSDHRISATFIFGGGKHTIVSTSSIGGRVLPEGNISVPHSSTVLFHIIPDPNYSIIAVVVDGVNMGTVPSHSFINVTSDHEIYALFRYSK